MHTSSTGHGRSSTGHDCSWYYATSKTFPEVCTLATAANESPVSCKSMQECFTELVEPKRYFVYERTVRIGVKNGTNGTLCLGRCVQTCVRAGVNIRRTLD